MIAQIRSLLQFFGWMDRDRPFVCDFCFTVRPREECIYARGKQFCTQRCANIDQMDNSY